MRRSFRFQETVASARMVGNRRQLVGFCCRDRLAFFSSPLDSSVPNDQGSRPSRVAKPACFQESNPPASAEASIPAVFRMSAAPALDSSAGHVQYVTIGFPPRSQGTSPSMRDNGM